MSHTGQIYYSRLKLRLSCLHSYFTQCSYDYLRPRWTINIDVDDKWNIPVILIDFDCWGQNAVRLWPQNNTQRENVLILERTPLSTPSVSSISIDSSGYNTVF